jgi:hypothetical protein
VQLFYLSQITNPFRQNLYIICELAQDLIKTRAQAHSWTIQSYPGKVKLPGDILRPQPNAETSNKVSVLRELLETKLLPPFAGRKNCVPP